MANETPNNLYVHFPFCRRKCTYCVLHSRAGVSPADRDAYVARLAGLIATTVESSSSSDSRNSRPTPFKTIYFGGGSPGLCDLTPFGAVLEPLRTEDTEFTVELNPLDVTREKLTELKSIGVNRISMGMQSLDDDILRHMGRGYTFAEAEKAFALIKEHFENAGIDLIVGYPPPRSAGASATEGEPWFDTALSPRHARLAKWGLRHCSVYSLILEEGSILAHQIRNAKGPAISLPDDETVLNRIAVIARFMKGIGLERYEISNYAVPGYECRHNLATWRGEDYLGLGDGACGRIGLTRTRNFGGQAPEVETLSAEKDEVERRIFSLRTREGLNPFGHPDWIPILDRFASEGLLSKINPNASLGPTYRLTERGTEVCDTILAELV